MGDPINTNSGVLSYTVKDLELQTSAGPLTFKRSYVSSWTSKFTSPLGSGWVHNQDIRLIFPGANEPSFVYFKDPSGNLYQFWYVKNTNTGAENFTPYAGFTASLIQNVGTPVTYTLRDQTQNVYVFDQSGKLTSLTNPNGQAFTYTYDANGRLDRVSADGGTHYLEFHYDTQNQLASVNDQTINRSVSFHYDANGDLDSFQDVLGQTWHYEYLNHLLTRVADPSNNTVESNEYYADGRASKQYDGEGHKTVELQYTSNNPLPTPIRTFNFESGTLSGWTIVSGTAFTSASVTNDMYWGSHPTPFLQQGTYHLWGYKAGGDGPVGVLQSDTVTLPDRASVRLLVSGGNDINTLYVALVRASDGAELFKVTGETTELYRQIVWDASAYAGQDVYIKLVDNNTGGWGHINVDDVEFISMPDSPWSILTTQVTDANGNITSHDYDARGTLIGNANDFGQTHKNYDNNFRPDTIQDAVGNPPTALTWSSDGANLEYIKDALNGETFISYNSTNDPTSILDPQGNETQYFYNDSNFPTLPTRIEYPLSFDNGATYIGTDYEYYPPSSGASAGKVKFVTDALGNQTYYTYTSSGQTETVTRAYGTPNALTTTYDYDALGRVVDMTNPQGVVTHNEYDDAGQLLKTTRNYDTSHPQNYQNKYNLVTEYRYDVRGNQIAVIDTNGIITRTYYDLANRPVTVVQNLVGQTIETTTPPARGTGITDQNIRTDTVYNDVGNVSQTIDPSGIITQTSYDAANRATLTIQNFVGTGAYDPANPDQNIRTEYTYDANGNVISTKDTLGVITRTYYDALNRPVSVVQHLAGQDISVTTPPNRGTDSNIRTDTYYDANGNVIATVDPKGITTRTYYDSLNRPVTVVQNLAGQTISNPAPPSAGTEANIRTDTYYDQAGNAIATVDPRGIVTRTYYDSANRPVTTVQNLVGQSIYVTTPPARGNGLTQQNARTDIAYDQFGRKDNATDPLGHVTKYTYDELSQLIQVTANYANGGVPQNDQNQRNIVTSYEYDALGRQTKNTDTLGRITLSAYDNLGRLASVTQNYLQGAAQNHKDASGNQFNLITTYSYDERSDQVAVKDTKDVITRTYYDALSRQVAVVRNLVGQDVSISYPPARSNPPSDTTNIRTDTVYLGNGSVDYVLDEMGKKTDYSYDAVGRLITAQDSLLNPTSYEYDANGNRTLMTDAEGVSTKYEYDGLNHLKAVVENYQAGVTPDNETNVRTEYTYDANGNRLSILDGNSHSSFFTYTAFGQLQTETDALGNQNTYDYDAIGNRTSLLDANGKTTLYTYDELNRLKLIDYPNPDPDVTYAYDALGRRSSMSDGTGTTFWNYTNIDLPSQITDPFGTGISYDYDAVGNRTQLDYGSQAVNYTYNNLNQLSQVSGGGLPNPVQYGYDAAGRIKSITRPNGVNTAYNYFDNGWLQDITHSSGATTLASYQYQYYPDGNRSQVIEDIQNPGQHASINSEVALSAGPSSSPLPGKFTSFNTQANQSVSLPQPTSLSSKPLQQADFSHLPLSFVANMGQFDKTVLFQTNSLGGSVFFTSSEVDLALIDKKVKLKNEEDDLVSSSKDNSKAVGIQYLNAEKTPTIEGLNLLPGVANFIVGSDKKAWVANAPTYDGIVYRNIYSGIDLTYQGSGDSLKSTFTVTAGADPTLIQWSYKGAGDVSLDADGSLLITLPAKNADQTDTTLVEHTPIAWQEPNGQRVDVPVQYSIDKKGEISFTFPQGFDASLPLIIDPTLSYSTYLGELGNDIGNAITTDAAGNAYVTGYSYCGAFPILNPLQGPSNGSNTEVIISKISADGSTLLYSTCVGGTGDDYGYSIALDPQGRVAVAGTTNSTDFPIIGGIATYGGDAGSCTVDAPCQDNFILALNADGSAIRYSTYLGGNGRETFGGMAVDTNGKVLLVGSTTSTNFPTVNAYDNSFATGGTCSTSIPCYDVTVTKIDPDLTGTSAILYSTYLGGTTRDKAQAMTIDSSGKVYLTGYTDSDNYPTRNALQATRTGSYDLLIAEIDPSLSGDASLIYSTYFGSGDYESPYAIARDSSGNLYITGRTSSAQYPLRDPLQYQAHFGSTCTGGASPCYEAFITKLNIATNTIVYSTNLGGSESDEGDGIAVDSYGRAYIAGTTYSTDFPVLNAIQVTKAPDGCSTPPCSDAFLSVLEPDGQAFAYSTYLGGDQNDVANGITVDSNNNVYIVGATYSTNFPTTPGAYDVVNTETTKRDVFISKIAALGAPTVPAYVHLDVPVATSSDDAEESSTGSVNLTSGTLELVRNTNNQTVGLRFAGVAIPNGATIVSASVQFEVDVATTEATSLTIQAQAVDDAPVFTTATSNISSRTKTTAAVAWSPVAWNNIKEAGPDERTPDLASVVQEVVNRPGWTSGNAIAIIITGTGQRKAKSYDKYIWGAPYLHVQYILPSQPPSGPVTINYVYDPLNRLKEANYSTGDYYHYSYDAVGNRLTQDTLISGLSMSTTYGYDIANRVTNVNGVTYTFDASGNLLSDGVHTYTYDTANHLKTMSGGSVTANYSYSGLGDRLQQTVNGSTNTFTMDLNSSLTQALSDGTNTYLYGADRIAQAQGSTTEYFLGDALGSVRQMADANAAITYTRAYDPYGVVTATSGSSYSAYGYTGEYTGDSTDLVYLRARYYAPETGRFFQKDPSGLERNLYEYASSNPVNFSDPTGLVFWAFRSGSRANLLGNPSTYNRNNNFAHPWIEYWVEHNNGFWNTHAEFPGKDLSKIDLIVFSHVNSPGFNASPVDFRVPVIGSVFEIEPANARDIIKGYAEIRIKEALINSGTAPFVHSGVLPMSDRWPNPIRSLAPYAGKPYDWSTVTWQFGTALTPSGAVGPVRVDPNSFGISGISGIPNAYWAMVATPGLILYVDEQTLQRSSGAGAAITSALAAKYILEQYRKAQDRPDGGLLPNPQPAPSYSQLGLPTVDPSDIFNFGGICTPNAAPIYAPYFVLNPWIP